MRDYDARLLRHLIGEFGESTFTFCYVGQHEGESWWYRVEERKYESAWTYCIRHAREKVYRPTRQRYLTVLTRCARSGNEFGRIDVGTIVLTHSLSLSLSLFLTLTETRPRTKKRGNKSLELANKPPLGAISRAVGGENADKLRIEILRAFYGLSRAYLFKRHLYLSV